MKTSNAALRVILLSSFVLLLGMGSFGTGILAERYVFHPRVVSNDSTTTQESSVSRDSTSSPQVDTSRIDEVLKLLEDEYFYGPIDRSQRLYDALGGLVNGLPDDYTRFLPPEQSRESRQQLSGEYEGIGIWVEAPEGKLTIISPMKGSPAESAGLLAGDVIVAIDGQPTSGLTQQEAVQRVRGPSGTLVHLTIERPGAADQLEFDVERAKIATPAVVYALVDDIAHISVTVFGDKTTAELDQALRDTERDGARGVVLDLRNNGGGWVNSAQEMIGRFVAADAGPAFFDDEQGDPAKAKPQPILSGEIRELTIPLVVLTNGGTASASEIVAGALRDYERATIIGTKTFGKGSIQRIHQFDDGSSVRITVAEWLTPQRLRIQGEGIAPDIEVQADAQVGAQDPQLDRALNYLRAR